MTPTIPAPISGAKKKRPVQIALDWLVAHRPTRARFIQSLLDRAEAGDPAAQFELAFRYDQGDLLPKDKATATKWYARAAVQGHGAAQALPWRSIRSWAWRPPGPCPSLCLV